MKIIGEKWEIRAFKARVAIGGLDDVVKCDGEGKNITDYYNFKMFGLPIEFEVEPPRQELLIETERLQRELDILKAKINARP